MPKDYGEVFIFISFCFDDNIHFAFVFEKNSQKWQRCDSLEMLLQNQIYRKETIPPKDTSITSTYSANKTTTAAAASSQPETEKAKENSKKKHTQE